MKLRDKFKTEFSINTSGESGRFADKCEKIADDFAVGFAEWFDDLSEDYCKDYMVKELLEIYKQENDL